MNDRINLRIWGEREIERKKGMQGEKKESFKKERRGEKGEEKKNRKETNV
jgi:hypothetical protein